MLDSKRSKSGCITCRIRRVKCDEERPECRRCTSTGRKCDGYSTLPFSRRELQAASSASSSRRSPSPGSQNDALSSLLNDPTFSTVLEKRCFQFFRHKTVSSTNSMIDSRFWDRVVLQACHSEPAIKHAILALSSWHQYLQANGETASQHRAFADKQYHLALQHTQTLISSADADNLAPVLITCILCIVYEAARGNFRASILHMDSGRGIVHQHLYKFRQAGRRSDLAEIQHTLSRLDASHGCFSDDARDYLYTVENFLQTNPALEPWQFQDIYEARNCLFDIGRFLLLVSCHMVDAYLAGDSETYQKYQTMKEACVPKLRDWYTHFEAAAQRTSPSSQMLVLTLRLWAHAGAIILETTIAGPETRFDFMLERFQAILSLGEQIVDRLSASNDDHFSYDLGYTNIVWFVAAKCRDPDMRRRALKLLKVTTTQECMLPSVPALAVVERLIELEEGDEEIQAAADVPEDRRVWLTGMAIHLDEQYVDARFHTSAFGKTPPRVLQERLHWDQRADPSGEMSS